MKFVTHLSGLVHQNSWLKIISGVLTSLLVIAICIIFTLSLRKPLVISQSSCAVSVAHIDSGGLTELEVKTFIRNILSQRFDSDVLAERAFFEDGEILAKIKEQSILKERNIKQKLLISDLDLKGDLVFVKSDRLISVGEIKSVLPLPLKVQLKRQTRSESNPYGLIITKVEPNSEKLSDKSTDKSADASAQKKDK